MRHRTPLSPVMLLLVVLGSADALADAATEARLRDALRSTTAQVRALEDERSKWQATEAELRREVQTLQSAKAPAQARPSDPSVSTLQRRLSEQADTNRKLKDSLARCQTQSGARATDAAGHGTDKDEERTRLTGEVTTLREQLKSSEARNLEMYQVGKDLIAWLEQIGVGGEPMFGWKRVQLENIAQDYEDKLYGKKVKQ